MREYDVQQHDSYEPMTAARSFFSATGGLKAFGQRVAGAGWACQREALQPPPQQVHGATYRHLFDLADWDRALATSAPGQSGQPGSPHYGDLLPLRSRGEYFPLALRSRAFF